MVQQKTPQRGDTRPRNSAVEAASEASGSATSPPGEAGPESRVARIRAAAYRRAESRGFSAGGELEDWLMAEREVDAEDEAKRQPK